MAKLQFRAIIFLTFILLQALSSSKTFSNTKFLLDKDPSALSQLPDNYDWRTVYPSCFRPVRNQGKCGSSYAISVAFALESRICITTRGNTNIELSPQDLLSCGFPSLRCGTEPQLKDTWEYLEKNGLASEKCLPYISKEGSIVPNCPSSCVYQKEPFYRYKPAATTFHQLTSVEEIKNDILLYGPVTSVMTAYEDLSLYNGGVYEYQFGLKMRPLTVSIIGWGKQEGRDFWIVRNTWGRFWGENGYFRVWINDGKSNLEYNAGVSRPQV